MAEDLERKRRVRHEADLGERSHINGRAIFEVLVEDLHVDHVEQGSEAILKATLGEATHERRCAALVTGSARPTCTALGAVVTAGTGTTNTAAFAATNALARTVFAGDLRNVMNHHGGGCSLPWKL